MEKPYILFAPHCDDELIGAYRLLKKKLIKEVWFCFDLTEERKGEACKSAEMFDFKPVFDGGSRLTGTVFNEDLIILAPHILDNHPEHKLVSQASRRIPNVKNKFYSIDMNVGVDVLSPEERKDKKSLLYSIYPSQKILFDRDEKYHLFEYLGDDHSQFEIYEFTIPQTNHLAILEVEVSETLPFTRSAESWVSFACSELGDKEILLSKLIQALPGRSFTFTYTQQGRRNKLDYKYRS